MKTTVTGVSMAYLPEIMNGRGTPSGRVLERLHGVLFQTTQAERVVPSEVNGTVQKKDDRKGVAVKGADSIRVGYTTGYDGHGRVSVNRIMAERGCSAPLEEPQTAGAGSGMVPGAG